MDKETEAIIVYGRSQMGKSTMISAVLARGEIRSPAVGEGDGASCTRSTAAYQTVLGTIIDVPGWDDSELRFKPEDVAQLASFEMAKHGIKSIRIGLFESAIADTNQLKKTMQNLTLGFGRRITSSIFVIMTKIDCMTSNALKKRVQTMKQKMKEVGLHGEPFLWQGVDLDAAQMTEQMNRLKIHVGKYPAVATVKLDDLNSQIMRKAQELCRDQVPQKKEHFFESSEVHDEKRIVTETVPMIVNKQRQVEEDFQTYETVTETYDEEVVKQRIEYVDDFVSVPYVEEEVTYETVHMLVPNPHFSKKKKKLEKLAAAMTGGISDLVIKDHNRHIMQDTQREVRRPVTKYKQEKVKRPEIISETEIVQKERQVLRPKIERRMVTKDYQEVVHMKKEVEKMVPVARTVIKKKLVEVELPVEHFIPKAREIVIEEVTLCFVVAHSSNDY